MKFTPIPGKPYEFASLHRHIDVAPFLELAVFHSAEEWYKNLDEVMLILIEHQALSGQSVGGDLLYELYFDLRCLRDLFKESEVSCSTSIPSSDEKR